jgi:hypothetical protein
MRKKRAILMKASESAAFAHLRAVLPTNLPTGLVDRLPGLPDSAFGAWITAAEALVERTATGQLCRDERPTGITSGDRRRSDRVGAGHHAGHHS